MPRTSSLASATAAGGSTWSAMIGAAASPGSSPIAGRSGSRRSPCCRDPIPRRSRHHQELLDPDAGQKLLAENGKWVRDRLARNGVPREAIEKHLSVIGNPPAMEAALA